MRQREEELVVGVDREAALHMRASVLNGNSRGAGTEYVPPAGLSITARAGRVVAAQSHVEQAVPRAGAAIVDRYELPQHRLYGCPNDRSPRQRRTAPWLSDERRPHRPRPEHSPRLPRLPSCGVSKRPSGNPMSNSNSGPLPKESVRPVSRFSHDSARKPAAVSRRNAKNGERSSTHPSCCTTRHAGSAA